MKKTIWGLEYQDYNSDGYIYRMVTIRKTFPRRFNDGKLHNTVGLNIKFLEQSQRDGIHKIVVCLVNKQKTLENMIYISVPTAEELYEKMRLHEYEDKPSKFVGGKPMRIYWFAI